MKLRYWIEAKEMAIAKYLWKKIFHKKYARTTSFHFKIDGRKSLWLVGIFNIDCAGNARITIELKDQKLLEIGDLIMSSNKSQVLFKYNF